MNDTAKWWAERIMAGTSNYEKVVAKFPKYKDDIDWWLARHKWVNPKAPKEEEETEP